MFKKINKIYKLLLDWPREKKPLKLLKIRNKREGITSSLIEIKGFIKKYYKKLHANKTDNLEEMDKFLETYKLPKLINKK